MDKADNNYLLTIAVQWGSGYELALQHGWFGFNSCSHHFDLKPWTNFLSGIAYHSHNSEAH